MIIDIFFKAVVPTVGEDFFKESRMGVGGGCCSSGDIVDMAPLRDVLSTTNWLQTLVSSFCGLAVCGGVTTSTSFFPQLFITDEPATGLRTNDSSDAAARVVCGAVTIVIGGPVDAETELDLTTPSRSLESKGTRPSFVPWGDDPPTSLWILVRPQLVLSSDNRLVVTDSC